MRSDGLGLFVVLVSKYGDKPQKSEFYSLKLIRAFEKELWDAQQQGKEGKVIQDYHHAYEARFFECFADWLDWLTSNVIEIIVSLTLISLVLQNLNYLISCLN